MSCGMGDMFGGGGSNMLTGGIDMGGLTGGNMLTGGIDMGGFNMSSPMDMMGGFMGTKASPPDPGEVNGDYLALLRGYAKGQPISLSTEATYKPAYLDLSLSNLNRALNGNGKTAGLVQNYNDLINPMLDAGNKTLSGMNSALPGTVDAIRNANPQAAALSDLQLKTATNQLAAGSTMDPGAVYRTTSQVRSDWANRGLGASDPAMLSEAMALYNNGQDTLDKRMANANATQYTNWLTLTNPAMGWVGGTLGNAQGNAMNFLNAGSALSGNAGPTLLHPASSYDIFNTAYNARAASDIATSNNNAAMWSALLGAGSKIGAAAM